MLLRERAKYYNELDRQIGWPPRSLFGTAIFSMLVGIGMLLQSMWLTNTPYYSLQLVGAWACFFFSFYLHNRYDHLSRDALSRLRDIIEKQVEEMRGTLTANDALALAISMAERERLSPTGELN